MTPSSRVDIQPDLWAARTLGVLGTMGLPVFVVASVKTSDVILRGNWWLYPAQDFALPLFCNSLTVLVAFLTIQYWRYPRIPFGLSRSAYWLVSASLSPIALLIFILQSETNFWDVPILAWLWVAPFPASPTIISLIAYFSLRKATNVECPAK